TRFQASRRVALIAGVLILIGPVAVSRIETSGFHRNAFGALWPRLVVHTPGNGPGTLRVSPFASEKSADKLDKYRGAAVGHNVLLIALESTAAQYLKLYGAEE